MPSRKALVTGASGFVGRAVCRRLLAEGWEVTGQHYRHAPPEGVRPLRACLEAADWPALCADKELVVHLAGMAHVPEGKLSLARASRLNVAPVVHLAPAARDVGAHLIFLSSAKVLGETGVFDDAAQPSPQGIYAETKCAAEKEIMSVPGLRYTILRPPLIYGPGVGANFLKLLQLVQFGLPLPFAWLSNRRSFLFVDNLSHAIGCIASNRQAAEGNSWLISDGVPLTLTELLHGIARGLGVPLRIFPVSEGALTRFAGWFGLAATMSRLTGSFVVEDRAIRRELNWSPPFGWSEGIQATAVWFKSRGEPRA